MSIRTNYEKHLKEINLKLLSMCRQIEKGIERAMIALINKDFETAKRVIQEDSIVDDMEIDLEKACLKVLLMEHPVAGDFRDVSAVLKMITDLERIADQSADICEIVIGFGDQEYMKNLEHLPLMGEIASSMVKDSVNAYVGKDVALANEVKLRDDKVDDLFKRVKKELVVFIKKDSENADQAILFMMIAKYLERIADHAVNICEWVNYAVSGKRI